MQDGGQKAGGSADNDARDSRVSRSDGRQNYRLLPKESKIFEQYYKVFIDSVLI